eukprot:CAMPEP_0119557478 /NCGR_PEP_ID=MMETSP1352-20130426/9132_1 /TAXON_ID=265584 /ORGANISM="Stauroneis constricta, Strain CCMP1120" /LENGTH=31 /DNA_ID= /DNA_START= /DNA_END= /DNA_ORIENTATION=
MERTLATNPPVPLRPTLIAIAATSSPSPSPS